MSCFVVDDAHVTRLSQVRARLGEGRRRDMSARTESMTLADVVDEFWPATDGWTTVSVEPGLTYVMTLLEHPRDGVAVCLLGAIPTGLNRTGREVGTPEQWESLDGWSRATWTEGVINMQAPSRPALIAAMQAVYADIEFPALAFIAPAGYLLTSQAFMDEMTSMFVALGDDRLLGHAASYQRIAALHGVPVRRLCVGEARAAQAERWAAQRPAFVAAQQMAHPAAPVAS